MAKEQVIYSKTSGLNLLTAPEALTWTPDGTVELQECDNCFITTGGKIERGLSPTLLVPNPGIVHTLYEKERKFYGVGTNLYEIVNDVSVLVKNNCSGIRVKISVYGGVAYCYDGVNFFTIKPNGLIGTWTFSSKEGAKSTRPFTGPVPHINSVVAWGRLFLQNNGRLYHSDPIGPNLFDLANNVVLDANPIQEVAAIKGLMVIATDKTVFALVGEDFKDKVRKPLFNEPAISGTLVSGTTNSGQPIVCFAVQGGLYAVGADGNAVELTEDKVDPKFFLKTFTGASYVNDRYTIHGGESFSVTVKTKALEQGIEAYALVSGSLCLTTEGVAVLGDTKSKLTAGLSEVTFPALSFDTLYKKSLRYLLVGGMFAAEATWTVTDERGNASVKVVPATGAKADYIKIPVSSSVGGQYLTVKFSTYGDFKLESLRAIPVIKASKH